MRKLDGRKIDHKTRESIRFEAIERINGGESPELIAKSLGFHRSCVYEWINRYEEGGWEGLRAKPITGRSPKVHSFWLVNILNKIVNESPRVVRYEKLWTKEIIKLMLRKNYNIELNISSVSRLVKKLGLLPEKPLKNVFYLNNIITTLGEAEQLTRIWKDARSKKTVLNFVGLLKLNRASSRYINSYLEDIGKNKLHLIYAIAPNGTIRFRVYTEKPTLFNINSFLEYMTYKTKKPVYIVIDKRLAFRKKRPLRKNEKWSYGKFRLFFLF